MEIDLFCTDDEVQRKPVFMIISKILKRMVQNYLIISKKGFLVTNTMEHEPIPWKMEHEPIPWKMEHGPILLYQYVVWNFVIKSPVSK